MGNSFLALRRTTDVYASLTQSSIAWAQVYTHVLCFLRLFVRLFGLSSARLDITLATARLSAVASALAAV